MKFLMIIGTILLGVLLPGTLPFCCAPPKPGDTRIAITSSDSGYIFDLKALPKVTIEISIKEWNRMHSMLRKNIRNEYYVKSDFIFEKGGRRDRINDIGLRIRGGNWSKRVPQFSPDRYKKNCKASFYNRHFRINFKKFHKNKRFYGLQRLLLRSFRADPLYARQILACDLLNRSGVPASRASYARLQIRIRDDNRLIRFGVYALVEPIDRIFLQSRFKDSGGHLWKCLTTKKGGEANLTHTPPLSGSLAGREIHTLDPKQNYQPTYDFKSHSKKRGILFKNAKKEFENFLKKLNTLTGKRFEQWITSVMDIEQLLKRYAMLVLISSWDDYWNNAKNYYLFKDSAGKWHLISDDYDCTFGSGFKWGGGKDFSILNVFRWGKKNRPLMNKIMRRPRFRKIYTAQLKAAMDPANRLFFPVSIQKSIRKWHRMIRPFVHHTQTDTQPDEFNNFLKIQDSPFLHYGGSPVPFKLLSGGYTINYLIRRYISARKQLGLPAIPVNTFK